MYSILKRVIDLGLAIAACIVLAPFMALLIAMIKLDSPGPVIFRQKRVGRDKHHFDILKFRTMRIDTPKDVPTHMLKDPDVYVTRAGRFLRRTSLDELPQLVNIIKGDMSIVGPRPALWNQYDLIGLRDKYGANGIRPGLTGLAQIMGRDELPIKVKARYDVIYCRKMCLSLDIKIILRTFGNVIRARGLHH
ncbi:MAG: sugar transferase [Defluviitaleaceae bacterium]|nr:sugar transferase [Defluviitaleaceae bacterium]